MKRSTAKSNKKTGVGLRATKVRSAVPKGKQSRSLFSRFSAWEDKMLQVIDNEGKVINPGLMPRLDKTFVLSCYKKMCFARMLDKWMDKYQRQGRLLSFLTSSGQEACEVIYATLLKPEIDWFSGAYRNVAAWLATGTSVRNILLTFGGNERGNITPPNSRILPANVVIGTQYSVATGLGFSEKYKKGNGIVVTTIGDGGTSEGEFYEAMNFGKLHDVPVVYCIENNQYAISTSVKLATKAINLCVKAVAAGIRAIKVDGNDLFACYLAVKEAYDLARTGKGPSCIEFVTYRLGPHSSSDDPKIYLPAGEMEARRKVCPIARLYKYLLAHKLWTAEQQAALDKEQEQQVKDEFKKYEEENHVQVEEVFEHTYEKLYPELQRQLAEAKSFNS